LIILLVSRVELLSVLEDGDLKFEVLVIDEERKRDERKRLNRAEGIELGIGYDRVFRLAEKGGALAT